jgi:hypothetical protein
VIVKSLPGALDGGRPSRCQTKFVRYPYPKNISSQYKVQYTKKDTAPPQDAFNLEKESKIINPHKMDCKTTHKDMIRGERGEKAKPIKPVHKTENRPTQGSTVYQQTFPNWSNGTDIFHERAPQYPVYQLPFRAGTTNKETLTSDKLSKVKELENKLR